MTPRDSFFSFDEASDALATRAGVKSALETFLKVSIGNFSHLSTFEIVQVLIEVLLWFADFISQPHYDFPITTPDILAGETITDPKDKERLGTVDSRKRNLRPRSWKLGNPKLQKWAWQLVEQLLGLPENEDSFAGSRKPENPLDRRQSVTAQLAYFLRKERRRRKTAEGTPLPT